MAFLKGCSGDRERAREEKKLCLVTETCCVAIVGDDVLIEPQTVWFFRPEVSFKQPRKREIYLSRAPLAASPWLHCSNVNGGLGDVGWDPLNPSPATSPLLLFSIKTAGIFQRVLAQWLMCNSSKPHLPPHSVIHRPGSSQRCFLLSTLFPWLWVESPPSSSPPSLSLCASLSLSLPCQPSIHYDFSLPQCYYFTSHWLTPFYSLNLFSFKLLFYLHQTAAADVQHIHGHLNRLLID